MYIILVLSLIQTCCFLLLTIISIRSYIKTLNNRLCFLININVFSILGIALLTMSFFGIISSSNISRLFIINIYYIYFYISEFNIEGHLKTNNLKIFQNIHILSELCILVIICLSFYVSPIIEIPKPLERINRLFSNDFINFVYIFCCVPILYSLGLEFIKYKVTVKGKVKFFLLLLYIPLEYIASTLGKDFYIFQIISISIYFLFNILITLISWTFYKRLSEEIIYDTPNSYLSSSLQVVLNNRFDINSKGYLEIVKSRAYIISRKIINHNLKEEEVIKFLDRKNERYQLLLSEVYNYLKEYHRTEECEEL